MEVLPAKHAESPAPEPRLTFTLRARELDSFREVLRQQALGDEELLRDAVAGREDPEIRLQVYDRLVLTRRLASQVGLTIIDRRRHGPIEVERGGESYLRVRLSALWVVFGILLSTLAVYTVWRLGLGALPVLYVPTAGYAMLRHGKRAGVYTIIACALAYLSFDPLSLHHDLRGGITLAALMLGTWLVRRDVF